MVSEVINKNNVPYTYSFNADLGLFINAICKDCSNEWLLFNMSKHGYNGHICHNGITVSNSESKKYICTQCRGKHFEINVDIRCLCCDTEIKSWIDFETS